MALGALPLFLARAGRVEAYGVASFLLAVLAFYAALISGARAVYLPLLLLLPSALLLLAREAGWRSLLLFLALGAGVVLLEGVVPGNALLNALTYKLALTQAEAQGESPGQGTPAMGNVEARLHMWRLALRLALDHPLGVGNGAYSQVFEAYMDYPGLPGVWSRSPHNHFLETLATGGWPRFILLLALLLPSLQGLGRQDWPWSLAVLGLWTPMLFDVSGYYPGYLALAFLLLGAFPQPAAPRTLGVAGLLAASLATLYWFWPCQGAACARQHLYFPQDTAKAVLQASREEAARLLAEAQRRYPLSPWPLTLAWEHTQDPEERLLLSRELARRFPNARESFYLLWAQSALGAGKPEEAQRALREGLRRFPSSHRLRELLAPQAPGQTRPP
nr:O-antigen ligase family protein [Thermus thalpophilus]